MHEALLAAGARKLVYPDSGPGPISAVGNDDVAYFGEVSNAEVFTVDEFKAQVPEFFAAVVANDNQPWLKFRYYGKFLFIKKKAIFTIASGNFITTWQSLYNAGLIYGEDGTGPAAATSYKINQLRLITKGAYTFKVRTITSDETEFATLAVSTNGSDQIRRKSMYTELLYRVVDNVTPAYPEKKFAKNLYQSISDPWEVCREILKNATYPSGIPLVRGPASAANPNYIAGYHLSNSFNLTTSILLWRPVLELVPSGALFNIRDIGVSIEGVMKGAISNIQSNIEQSTDPNDVTRLTNLLVETDAISYASDIKITVENLGTDNITRLTEIKMQTVNRVYVTAINASVSE